MVSWIDKNAFSIFSGFQNRFLKPHKLPSGPVRAYLDAIDAVFTDDAAPQGIVAVQYQAFADQTRLNLEIGNELLG